MQTLTLPRTPFMPKVFHKKGYPAPPEGAIYIGRPSKFGNPFMIGPHGTREEVIEKYREWVMVQPILLREIKNELKGKDLICWCAPKPCHGDILLEIANVFSESV